MKDDFRRYLLLTQTHSSETVSTAGAWRFVLQGLDDGHQLDAADIEPGVTGERLGLLTVIRGLEALEQESCVTLITDQRYVVRGLRYGLEEWREQEWKWQRFGELTEIANADLWQRLDNALQYHRLRCRYFRLDAPTAVAAGTGTAATPRRIPRPHFARRAGGRAVLADQPASSLVCFGATADPVTRQLDPHWMAAAKQLGEKLGRHWEVAAVS